MIYEIPQYVRYHLTLGSVRVRTWSAPRARASLSWPWPLLSRAGPPILGPDPRTFRAGPGRPSGHGPLALPVDSLGVDGSKSKRTYVFLCSYASHFCPVVVV